MNVVYFKSLAGQRFSEALLPLLSYERRLKIGRLKREQDKLCSAWSELLLFQMAEDFGLGKIEIKTAENGKPYLENGVHISLSHTENAVAAAVCTKPVGVDIERIKTPNFDVARRCFSDAEQEYCVNSPNHFYEIWTRKEAYTKRSGEGIFTVGMSKIDTLSAELCKEIKTTYIDDYVLSVCSVCSNDIQIIKKE